MQTYASSHIMCSCAYQTSFLGKTNRPRFWHFISPKWVSKIPASVALSMAVHGLSSLVACAVYIQLMSPYSTGWHHILNSTQRASMDAGVKTLQCPHLSNHFCISSTTINLIRVLICRRFRSGRL